MRAICNDTKEHIEEERKKVRDKQHPHKTVTCLCETKNRKMCSSCMIEA